MSTILMAGVAGAVLGFLIWVVRRFSGSAKSKKKS